MLGSAKDLLRDLSETNVTDYTQNGKCSNCGECCTDLMPVTDSEISKIHKYLRSHNIKEQKMVVAVNAYDITCPFRDNIHKKCLIYEVRPSICRKFLCSQSYDEVDTNKIEAVKAGRQISMRQEFFGNSSTNDMMMKLAAILFSNKDDQIPSE